MRKKDNPANGLAWARSATQSEKTCDPSVVFKRSGWRGEGGLLEYVCLCVSISRLGLGLSRSAPAFPEAHLSIAEI